MPDRLLQLAAAVTLLAAATAHAQIISPDVLVAPAPRNPIDRHHDSASAPNNQWLWQYTTPATNGNKQALEADPRFNELLSTFRAPQSMWGSGIPLADAARQFLAGDGAVTSDDNRHILISGCVKDHCTQRGLLWLDLGGTQPLAAFAAMRWNEQGHTSDEPNATYELWLFPSREIEPDHLPAVLQDSLRSWAFSGTRCIFVNHVLLVEPNGVPHIMGTLQAGLSTNNSTSCHPPDSTRNLP